ncbi:Uncharacterized protein APZ42_005951 [Daphnia magna]|uniref:Uncharacterized protein n=1 Tax=Daphnia magna TaxID=35525 RepID=A0A164G5S7_9CRUS|nr:Uncharacterized protein APZ42_005951 [Daphnia magna]
MYLTPQANCQIRNCVRFHGMFLIQERRRRCNMANTRPTNVRYHRHYKKGADQLSHFGTNVFKEKLGTFVERNFF